MTHLIAAFLKMFFRNRRAIFFVMFLPAALYLILAFLRFEQVIQFTTGQDYPDFLLPGIVAFAVMQMGIYTVAYSLIDFRKQMVLKRLAVTPLGAEKFLLAQGLARFVIAMVQTVLLVLLGAMIFGTKLHGQMVLVPIVILLGMLVFLNLGSIIASFARDYEEAAPYTTIVGLSLGFLGDAFFPVANLPVALQTLAAVLPMKPFVSALRYSFFGIGANEIIPNFLTLAVWLAASTVAAKIIFARKAYR